MLIANAQRLHAFGYKFFCAHFFRWRWRVIDAPAHMVSRHMSHLEGVSALSAVERDHRLILLSISDKARKPFDAISARLDGAPSHIKRMSCASGISKARALAFQNFSRGYRALLARRLTLPDENPA